MPCSWPSFQAKWMAYLPTPLAEFGLIAGLNIGRAPGLDFTGSPGSRPVFHAFLVAQGAGAGVPQVLERVVTLVAVFPVDVHARPGGQVHIHGLWLGPEIGGHKFSIA